MCATVMKDVLLHFTEARALMQAGSREMESLFSGFEYINVEELLSVSHGYLIGSL